LETLTTDELIARFASDYQQYHRISDERAKQQRKLLRQFGDQLAPRSLQDMEHADFMAFAVELQQHYHVNTVRKKLNQIRPFISWAYGAHVITADQYLRLKTVQDPRGASGKTKPRPYTPDQVRALWAAIEVRLPLIPAHGKGSFGMRRWLQGKSPFRVVARHGMRLQVEAIVRLALDAGLRRQEIFRLTIHDAHYDNSHIRVTGVAKGENFDKDMVRMVPMTKELRKTLHAWVEFRALMHPSHDDLWCACYGPLTHANPMSEDRFNHLLSDLLGGGWELHRLRHTAGTEWLRAGAPLETVSELLGHENLQQTRAYTEIVATDIERELGKVEDNFNRRLRRVA
jgi:site-specific recombinase XerD